MIRAGRSAFTLLEVLVTMALIVACFSIAWPSLVAMIGSDRLDRASEDLCGLIVGLRLRAIEDAERMTLEIEPGSGRYRIVSDRLPADAMTLAGQATSGRVEYDDDLGIHELDVGLSFQLDPQDPRGAGAARDGVLRIVFSPDGSVTDSLFAIADSEQRARWIEIRGLTGSVRLGPARPLGTMQAGRARSTAAVPPGGSGR